MEFLPKMTFNNLKPHISSAIKESCPTANAIIYKIADEVHHLEIEAVEPGVEIAQDLSRIIDKTIKDAVELGVDVSVIVKGLLLGAFRASPFIAQEAHKTIRILIEEILQSVFKYNGDATKTTEGLLAAIVIIAKEFKLNTEEALIVAKENIQEVLSRLDDT